jgi:hypothetical protein
MKMVKRSLIAIAIVALFVTAASAAVNPAKYDDHWPYEYVAVDICVIPVYMDVGMYVQIKDCGKKKIVLKQVNCEEIEKSPTDDFPCYKGCSEFEIRANFEAKLGTHLEKEGPTIKEWAGFYNADKGGDIVPGTGAYFVRDVCVKAWKTEIWNTAPGDEVKVGTCAVTVKPN